MVRIMIRVRLRLGYRFRFRGMEEIHDRTFHETR